MIVLDTHVLLWWVNGGPEKLSAASQRAIHQATEGGRILVSSMTAWEIAMLIAKGRLMLSMDVTQWLSIVHQIDAVQFAPIDADIAVHSTRLPGAFHPDPADRIIVATARHYAAPLLTRDDKILAYPHVQTIRA